MAITTSCFEGRFGSGRGSGSGRLSMADHSCSINATRLPTFRLLSTPGSAFHNAKSRLPLSGAVCSSSFDVTTISPSLTVAKSPFTPARQVLPLPDKPSVAVLPFTNMSSDPEQEFFADGIAEDVITALSHYPSLLVIARNSSFTYKGRAVDVKQIGRELGVRYILEGSLRKSGNRIRVTAQLVEAETGKHVWAERYDRDLADIFALQDEITEAVTIAIAPAIAEAEQQRAMRKPPGSLDAWAAYQRGLWHLNKVTTEDNALAEQF